MLLYTHLRPECLIVIIRPENLCLTVKNDCDITRSRNNMAYHLFVVLLSVLAAADAFKFLAIGDWGVGRQEQVDIAEAMARHAASNNIEFIVSTGDNFYTLGEDPPVDRVDHPFFNTRWRYMYNQTSLRNLTWYITLGNHDYCDFDFDAERDCEWVQVEFGQTEPRWHLPYLWYSFYRDTPAGRLHMIVTDTHDWQFDFNNSTAQLNWLRNELQTSQGDVKIVVSHYPIYSAGRYGPDINIIFDLEELLMQYNVPMYLTGHDHNLQHLQYLNGTGPEFVISGGGGRRLYAHDTPDEELEEVGVRLIHFEYDHGFTEVEVTANSLRFSHINAANEVVHSHTRPL